jgi:hypothetical protein
MQQLYHNGLASPQSLLGPWQCLCITPITASYLPQIIVAEPYCHFLLRALLKSRDSLQASALLSMTAQTHGRFCIAWVPQFNLQL